MQCARFFDVVVCAHVQNNHYIQLMCDVCVHVMQVRGVEEHVAVQVAAGGTHR